MFRCTSSLFKRLAAASRAPRTQKPLGRWSKPKNEDQLARTVKENNEAHCGSACDWEEGIILREAKGAWLAYNRDVLEKKRKD